VDMPLETRLNGTGQFRNIETLYGTAKAAVASTYVSRYAISNMIGLRLGVP
jgi:hypothetical protein